MMKESNHKEKQLSIIGDEFDSLMKRIITNHVNAGQVASGRTKRSLRKVLSGEGGEVLGRAYFGVLETGRKPGGVPKGFRHIIRQWMKDKGIVANPIPYVRKPSDKWKPKYTPQERGDMSLAGAIAYRIKNEGTRLYRDGGRDDIYSNEIPITIENILDRVLAVFAEDVESININSINEDKGN